MKKHQKGSGKPIDRRLSSIELTVLGLAWLRGPCTTYSIMKELSMSASSFYKARMGTTYSVAHRLIGFGLLEQAGDEEGKVRITKAGVVALQAWIERPVPMADIAHTADLLRLRFFFLGVVDPGARLAFIDDSLSGLEKLLERSKELIAENEAIGDYFGALATLSVVLETKARIEWLRTVRDWVANPIGTGVDWTEAILKRLEEV